MRFFEKVKNIILILFSICCFVNIFAQSPCTLQNKIIRRQSQLDSIPLLYPGCRYIDSIVIRGTEIVDLSALKKVSKFNFISLSSTSIKSLDGLDSLQYCKAFLISYNDSLENILALKNTKTIEFISIAENNNLLGYEGLEENCTSIVLHGNNKCRSLKGIKAENLESLIVYYPSLETFSGHEIKNIYNLSISYSKHINGIGSFNVKYLGIELSDSLENIGPVDSLKNLLKLHLLGNKNLSMCSIDLVCRNLDNPGFDLQLFWNAPGCNSKAEIRQKCISSTNQNETENELSLFPNPVHESLQISGLGGDVSFFIYNHVGALIQKGITAGDIDVSGLPSGMYILTFTGANSGDKSVFRFVKM
jgi:hypothetical protein